MAYAGDKLRVDRVFILKDVSNCGANVLAHSSEELRSDRTDVRSITSVGVVMRHQHGCRYRGFGQDSSCISKSGPIQPTLVAQQVGWHPCKYEERQLTS